MSVSIFFCYAHEDETLLKKLKAHLRPLQRQGLVTVWYDRDISAGSEWEQQIKEQLNSAQIILLLVSPNFMDSDYCYGIEMKRAIERHERGEAKVIPIILRPVYWQGEPLGRFQALPTNAKPVRNWSDQDKAFFEVAESIRKVCEQFILARLLKDAFTADDDDAIVAAYNQLQQSGHFQSFTFTEQQRSRIQLAQKRHKALVDFRDALKSGRLQQTLIDFLTILADSKNITQEEREILTMARDFFESQRTDDDDAILTAFDKIQRSRYRESLTFTEQLMPRIQLAQQRHKALVNFRDAQISGRIELIVNAYDPILDSSKNITWEEKDRLLLARSFLGACSADDDNAIMDAYDQIQNSHYRQSFTFTEQQRSRIQLAQQRKEALTKWRLALYHKQPELIINAYDNILNGSKNVTSKEREILNLIHGFIMAYTIQDDETIEAAYNRMKSLPNGDKAFFNMAEGIRKIVEHLIIKTDAISQPEETETQNPFSPTTSKHGQKTPQLRYLIFLLDQSGSMFDLFARGQAGGGRRKADVVTTVLNYFLSELIKTNTIIQPNGTVRVKHRADITILGYEGNTTSSVFSGRLANKMFVTLPDLHMNPIDIEMRRKQEIDEEGNIKEEEIATPIWFKPKAGGSTPMRGALLRARELAEQWVINHRNDYPPIVVNITDGVATDGDITEPANELCQISTTRGQALFYNVHITSMDIPPVAYPSTEKELPNDPFGKQLFLLSSIIPEDICQRLQLYLGRIVPVGSRGLIYNGDAASVRLMLMLAT